MFESDFFVLFIQTNSLVFFRKVNLFFIQQSNTIQKLNFI